MKKHVFLTGPESDICSELLLETLGPALAVAGGFVKERFSGQNQSLGLALRPASAAAGVEGCESYPFLLLDDAGLRKDNEVFRSHGVRLLREAAYYPFAVLDDIGGFELVIPQYRQALAELLSSELPLIGVLKGQAEACEQARSLGLGERFSLQCARLQEALREDAGTLVLELNAGEDDGARRAVQQWMKEFVF